MSAVGESGRRRASCFNLHSIAQSKRTASINPPASYLRTQSKEDAEMHLRTNHHVRSTRVRSNAGVLAEVLLMGVVLQAGLLLGGLMTAIVEGLMV